MLNIHEPTRTKLNLNFTDMATKIHFQINQALFKGKHIHNVIYKVIRYLKIKETK